MHPYILADNRHFTFYLWKNIFGRYSWAKFAFIPGYAFSSSLIVHQLGSSKASKLWTLFFFICCMVVLCPAHLLELRYFILPYLLLRLHVRNTHLMSILSQILWFMTLNTVTIYLFLEKPFLWPNETNPMRFMW